jgi:hypothetical protein
LFNTGLRRRNENSRAPFFGEGRTNERFSAENLYERLISAAWIGGRESSLAVGLPGHPRWHAAPSCNPLRGDPASSGLFVRSATKIGAAVEARWDLGTANQIAISASLLPRNARALRKSSSRFPATTPIIVVQRKTPARHQRGTPLLDPSAPLNTVANTAKSPHPRRRTVCSAG